MTSVCVRILRTQQCAEVDAMFWLCFDVCLLVGVVVGFLFYGEFDPVSSSGDVGLSLLG